MIGIASDSATLILYFINRDFEKLLAVGGEKGSGSNGRPEVYEVWY